LKESVLIIEWNEKIGSNEIREEYDKCVDGNIWE
jgi:hypothetical protein